MKKFWNWTDNPKENGRTLFLNGTIADESWYDDDVTPQLFKNDLYADSGDVTVWLNSPGGDCVAAAQIYNMLKEYPGNVTIKIDGIAASAASVIAMAGTTVLMAPTALMMIHNPMTMAFGDYEEMQKAMEMLDEVKESIINAYEIRTGISRAKLSHLMDSETWMNANKAIEFGFADDVLKDDKRGSSNEAFAFSAKAAQVSLMNKLSKPATKVHKDNPAKAAVINKPEVQADATPADEVGTPIKDLDKRLSLLK